MGLIAKDSGGGDFERAPEGTHLARCYQIIDLGTQHSEYYGKSSRKVLIGWELSDEHMTDGRPFAVSTRWNSASARSASNQWNDCARITRSTEPSGRGSASAAPRT